MNDKLSVREEVPVEQTWRLEDIYPDERLWEEELQQAKDLAAKVKEYEGKLSDNGVRTVRISAADRPRAEQVLALNAAADRLKQ